MSMTVGTNTYVTLSEADAYVDGFRPNSAWNELTNPQKEQRLVLATEQLEALPFTGRKTERNQPLAFPRFPSSTVPESIKAAQVEIAVFALEQTSSVDASQRATLQRQGVTSFSLGDISESYGGQTGLAVAHAFLADATIRGLLARFLQGGYPIVR